MAANTDSPDTSDAVPVAAESDKAVKNSSDAASQDTPAMAAEMPTEAAEESETKDDEPAPVDFEQLEKDLNRLGSRKVIDEHEFKVLRKTWEEQSAKQADSHTPEAELGARIETVIEKVREAVHKQVEVRNQKYEKLLAIVDQFEEAIFNDKLQDALQHQQDAKTLIGEIPALSSQRRADVHERLNRQHEKISELRKWRRWATNITRDELIEQIEALAANTETPVTERAQKIQEARSAWQQWDKSADTASRNLWTRFDAACTKAYEPCKQHFAQQAERRAANNKKMQDVCESLEKLATETNWREADWRQIDKDVRNAKRDWYKKPELEHRDRRHLNKRFANVMSEIDPQLDRERKRNRNAREALIKSVEALASVEDLEQAMQAAKDAQGHWKTTVLGSRKDEQEMWKRFTTACDAVYARKKQQRKDEASVEKDNAKLKLALCDKIEALGKAGDLKAGEIESQLNAARGEWRDIGPVNKKRDREIENRFKQLCKAAQSQAQTAASQHTVKTNELLKQKALVCAELELGGADDIEAAQTQWNDLAKLPDKLETAITQRFEAALKKDDANAEREKNQETLETLMLDAEIMAGVDSPPEYAKARMALQVSKLSSAMSGAKNSDEKSSTGAKRFYEIEQTFWLTGAVPDKTLWTSLTQRLDKVRAAMAEQAAKAAKAASEKAAQKPANKPANKSSQRHAGKPSAKSKKSAFKESKRA